MNKFFKVSALINCLFPLLLLAVVVKSQTPLFPVYNGSDMGCTYSKTQTIIRVYAPGASALQLLLYKNGNVGVPVRKVQFRKDKQGTWVVVLKGGHSGLFYTLRANYNGIWSKEVTDPYAKAVGVNGDRAQILDLSTTNPPGWETDQSPVFSTSGLLQDAVIYELHLRDVSMHPSSGIKQKGLFTGLTEHGTQTIKGNSTGLSHIKELGVTHVHLLPVFDFSSIDESKLDKPAYNWGYDPKNYNAPDGSYSSNPFDPSVRIREMKQMVLAFHRAGLRVVMDVVYNHTAVSAASNFHQLVPGYYHRIKPDGSFADASACGNETASEKPMMRKFMIESLVHWVKEYHIDGFRFDLMAIHDQETMNLIADTLRKLKPDILLYGEGWAAAAPLMQQEKMAFKKYVNQLHHIAVFSDDIRDGIKGYVFDEKAKGFVNGNPSMTETVKFGITGSVGHPQINMSKAFYDKVPYAFKPAQVINYVDCHDNLTLWDKLTASAEDAGFQQKKAMQELALALVLTAQGIPFLHAGSEFLRSKKGVENSFNQPDSINAIDWQLKDKNLSTFHFIQQLITLRKSHELFRLKSVTAIQQQIRFLDVKDGVIAYTIERITEADPWKKILVVCNPLATEINLPSGAEHWSLALSNQKYLTNNSQMISVPAQSFSVFYVN